MPRRTAAIAAALEDPSTALAWFDAEHANLVAAVRQAAGYGEHEMVYRFADAPKRLSLHEISYGHSWL